MQKFIKSSLFILATVISNQASAVDAEDYDLTCSFNKTQYHQITFRFAGSYVPARDPVQSRISDFKSVLASEPDLYYLAIFEGQGLAADPRYTARPNDVWAGHSRFWLHATAGGNDSAPDQQLIISPRGTNCRTENWDNHVNTGTKKTCTFHAGLNYSQSDQDGTRTPITCTGVHTVINRRP